MTTNHDATHYHRTGGTVSRLQQSARYRPSWCQSSEYRLVITGRIDRDLAAGCQIQGPHIDGSCGGRPGRSCDACTADVVRLLRAWAARTMPPPVIGEEASSYWARANGPQAERWALVARVMVESAKGVIPVPDSWYHCECCGAEGVNGESHNCAQRRATADWSAKTTRPHEVQP